VLVDPDGGPDVAAAIAPQPNGKIVVGGTATRGGLLRFVPFACSPRERGPAVTLLRAGC
jgi:hypothetical protein